MMKCKNKKVFVVFFVWCLLLTCVAQSSAGVRNTKHNLSVSGPGPIKSTSENEICIFCHTPHNANPAYPLWNHDISMVNYTNYWSSTLKSYSSPGAAPPIDGFSQLCLGCHDGTIALGAVGDSRSITFSGDVPDPEDPGAAFPQRLKQGDYGYLGTDLSGGHPISIIFDKALADKRNSDQDIMHLIWPINDPEGYVKIYPTQDGYGVQCTSCHDPHGGRGGSEAPPFWQKQTYEAVCLVCHDASPQIGHTPNPGP
jgi:predicted CXXCH cytochrome family protein